MRRRFGYEMASQLQHNCDYCQNGSSEAGGPAVLLILKQKVRFYFTVDHRELELLRVALQSPCSISMH